MPPRRPGNYEAQARTYDRTRGASPTVVRILAKYLGSPDGHRLLDVAGGTGNYAQVMQARGFDVFVTDIERAMLAGSVRKLGPGRQVVADATALPFRDQAFDCAMIVTAIHLIKPAVKALAEARRLIRDGPLVVSTATEENVRHLFIRDYFPTAHIPFDENPPRAQLENWVRQAGFSRVEWETFVYLDSADATLVALHTDPLRLAGPAYLRNTSFFQRLPEPAQREGLAKLAGDLRSGVLEEKVKVAFQESVKDGHGTVFACWP